MPDIPYSRQAEELTGDEILGEPDRLRASNDAQRAITGFPYPPATPQFYIKFGNRGRASTAAEARTRQFVFDALEKMPQESRKASTSPRFTVSTVRAGEGVLFGKTLRQLYRSNGSE
jgi:hypothetical protein